MSRGRAYMKADDDLYRVVVSNPGGGSLILGPYASLGAARAQATRHGGYGYDVEVQVASPSWRPVPAPDPK
ncbi:hypothetical protein HOU70_gp61 [Arthrobacter phage Liebe]|uniref:Uncharacterized protein n=2 Tax=Arthrobacter virus Liebe TaxID=2734245 RepID=A0A3G2KHS1_9CAUD|nr:hypothetical protein HOU70_gp61 [Arthrobacter phage Liebe]AYN58542.1 hypothetical protein PBI_MAUREEN_61 [Arthrobacter phage Maureen]AZF93794.1 hypothetical protein PBI_LIEBE_61 [Arthrobacter phage Liebe]